MCIAIALTLSLATSVALADIYYWTDEDGVLNVTDDPDKVPFERRDSMKVLETTPYKVKPATPADRVDRTTAPDRERPGVKPGKAREEELFGDHPVQWWDRRFTTLSERIGETQSMIDRKKEYVSVFERGRGLGQIYEQTEIDTYNRFKSELDEDQSSLDELERQIEDLRREATYHGVPKKVRK